MHGKLVREGEANREEIFQIVNEKGPVSVDDIYKYVRESMSKHTIHVHLKGLLEERRIYKNEKERTYVILDHDLGYMTTFAKKIKDAFGFMISPHLLIKNPDNNSKSKLNKLYLPKIYLPPSALDFMDTSMYENFCNRVSGISVSQSICKPKITKDNINKIHLFEFVNRIGAYITHLFIESMRPLSYNMKEENEKMQLLRRDMLSRNLLRIAINLEQMFQIFHCLLYDTNQIKKKGYPSNKPIFFELEKEDYNNISNTFRKVYPGIYDGLEEYWQEITRLWLINTIKLQENLTGKKVYCNHKWNLVHLFKLEGEYYHCRRCNNVINKFELKNRINKRQEYRK
jgi:hypothetical protein